MSDLSLARQAAPRPPDSEGAAVAAAIANDPIHHYWLAKALYDLNLPANREAFLKDSVQYLVENGQDLSPDEKQMLQSRDIAGLHRLGISIYLIRTLALISDISIIETGVLTGGRKPQQR